MEFRTSIKIAKSSTAIDHNSKLFFLGSCFSGNIGAKFASSAFESLVNPFGVLFNPYSIFNLLDRSIDQRYFTENDWILFEGKWINLDLHGALKFDNLDSALKESNSIIDQVHNFLIACDVVFLTYGSAWVYKYKSNMQTVANCHKIPQKNFVKNLLLPEEINQQATIVLDKLKGLNPNANVVLTVSPVRHWADGAQQNNISKGVLHLSIHLLAKERSIEYFPSYELVNDELRDYRFFAQDMLHPNELATEYVWQAIKKSYFSEATNKFVDQIDNLRQAAMHRPFDVESEKHQQFVQTSLQKLRSLKRELKASGFSELEELFKTQIRN